MKTLFLAATLPALLATGAQAAGESVLERVLGSINSGDNMTMMNGVFANIAESIPNLTTGAPVWTDFGGVVTSESAVHATVDAFLADQESFMVTAIIYDDRIGRFTVPNIGHVPGVTDVTFDTEAAAIAAIAAFWDSVVTDNGYDNLAYQLGFSFAPGDSLRSAIDGSITNTLSGVSAATSSVGGTVLAVQHVGVDVGDLSTTVLGAVNTGEITLGVNQDVTEAIAGSSSAVSNAITQLGGTTGTGALVLNVAANTSDIIGSVSNSFAGLNGTVGNVSTTVLGAVNTGTITSGINAAVSGIQSGIVGN